MKNTDNIKEHFQAKTIQPSENSWNKLENLLNENEKKSSRKLGYLKYVSVACFLLIGLVIWDYNQVEIPVNKEQEVVIEQHKNSNFEVETNKKSNVSNNKEVIVSNSNIEDFNSKKEIEITQKNIKKEPIFTSNQKNNQQNILEKKVELLNKELIFDHKKETLAFENTNEKLNENTENREITQSKITIDADLLLKSAEKDLDIDHRDKTLLKFKNGFNQLKTYVNNVNYE
jgi:preprotein translocase subunit SecF